VRCHLPVYGYEALVSNIDASLFCGDSLAVRLPADGHQNQIIALRLLGRRFPRELYMDPTQVRIYCDRLRLQHDPIETRRIHFLPDGDEIAIGARHQAVEHLDDVNPRAQYEIDGRRFKPDDAAAKNQHFLRDGPQLEGAGRIDDARIARNKGQGCSFGTGGDDGGLEADDFWGSASGRSRPEV